MANKQFIRDLETVKEHLTELSDYEAAQLLDKAIKGGEINENVTLLSWIERAKFGLIKLNETDYTNSLAYALKVAPILAGTDFGTTRQRDLGQLWTDTARGFLGEIAFAKFVKERFNIDLVMDYSLGEELEAYLPSDVKSVIINEEEIQANKSVSIKTTKFNGLWLDIPGSQITHSDYFVFVKTGVPREHFIGYLKNISFLKDKLFPRAVASGVLNDEEANQMWNELPVFADIHCYISGFLNADLVKSAPQGQYRTTKYKDGETKGYLMKNYLGWVKESKPYPLSDDLDATKKFEFESIGSFSGGNHFISSAGYLKHSQDDWKEMITSLLPSN